MTTNYIPDAVRAGWLWAPAVVVQEDRELCKAGEVLEDSRLQVSPDLAREVAKAWAQRLDDLDAGISESTALNPEVAEPKASQSASTKGESL